MTDEPRNPDPPSPERSEVDLSVIIPAYNEEGRIGRTLQDYLGHFEPEYGDRFEIVVITDGCKDRTCEIISNLDSGRIRHYNYGERLGKGLAISKGYEQARGGIVCYTDADGSTPPDQLWHLIRFLETSDCDGVAASRYSEGGSAGDGLTLSRRVASRGYNLMVRLLFALPYRDTQCGAKVFKKEVAKDIFRDLVITDWAFDVNLLYNAHKRGYDVREVGINWADCPGSKVNMGLVVPKMFMSTLRLRLINSHLGFLANNRLTRTIGSSLKHRWGEGK
jgi:glycosyltransferase involved in cell wall biosynthesis